MKNLTTIFLSAAVTLAAFAAEPAGSTNGTANAFKPVSEKALAAHKEALAIDGMLRSKNLDFAVVAQRAETLNQYVDELHEALQSLDASQHGAVVQKLTDSANMLKVIASNKAKELTGADASQRARFRATAKNIAMRAEEILKTSRKIGG